MSFSYDAKNELCRLDVQRHCCARAEAYGILLYCNTFNSGEVRIVTENQTLPKGFHGSFIGRSTSALTADRSRRRPGSWCSRLPTGGSWTA